MDIWTKTRKELKTIRDEDLALSALQYKIFTAKYIDKITPIDIICRKLNISPSTYQENLRKIKLMLQRLYEQEIAEEMAKRNPESDQGKHYD